MNTEPTTIDQAKTMVAAIIRDTIDRVGPDLYSWHDRGKLDGGYGWSAWGPQILADAGIHYLIYAPDGGVVDGDVPEPEMSPDEADIAYFGWTGRWSRTIREMLVHALPAFGLDSEADCSVEMRATYRGTVEATVRVGRWRKLVTARADSMTGDGWRRAAGEVCRIVGAKLDEVLDQV